MQGYFAQNKYKSFLFAYVVPKEKKRYTFEKLFGHLEEEEFRVRLKKALFHEITLHLEFLTGKRGEIEDTKQLVRYRKERGIKYGKNSYNSP